ncbi:hypothetical protein GCK32_002343, partial [Trichostrongylus colubriformis]
MNKVRFNYWSLAYFIVTASMIMFFNEYAQKIVDCQRRMAAVQSTIMNLLNLCVLMLFTHIAIGQWACPNGELKMEIGLGVKYFPNKSSPIDIPPNTKCKIEIFAKPPKNQLIAISMTLGGRNVGKEKLHVKFDDDDIRGLLFYFDPIHDRLPPVGHKYIMLINIPPEGPPAELFIKFEGEI